MANENTIFVATSLLTLALHGNSTLKGKRSVVSRVKSRVSNEFNVSIAEVAALDRLQTAVLGIAAISGNRIYLEGQMQKVIDFIGKISTAEIADVQLAIEVKGGHGHAFI